ncbi:innexin inx4-like [Chironomus tepperi]|uniref:innexin inx4-like n=1 Tax=Chironomus tepperi TaxID=113505 RepID=UPI00391F7767
MLDEIIRKISPLWHSKGVRTTSFIFKLVTKYTVNMFIVFTILISGRHLFGHPIQCFSSDKVWLAAMDLSCWIDGVFLDEKLIDKEIGKEVVRYGVGSPSSYKGESKYLTYGFYQWIVPLLLFQTLCLFIPRAIWHMYEKGTMSKILDKTYAPVFTDDWDKQRKQLVAYIKDIKLKYHRDYAMKYLFCEFLTIIVIVINMLLLNTVIRDFFSVYQPAVSSFFAANYTQFNRNSAYLFPIQAKCKFDAYGPSGGIQTIDALCILPQNVINDKIFVIIYVWFILILLCSIFHFIYLCIVFSFQKLRIFQVGRMLEREVTIRKCKDISNNGDLGLWFTLRIFRHNLSPICFQSLCNDLAPLTKKSRSFDEYDNESIYMRESA